jgi:hypothetical protein
MPTPAEFDAAQWEKWERFKGDLPGLQHSRSASGRHILRISVEGFDDSIVYARPGYTKRSEPGPGPMVRSKRVVTNVDVPPLELSDDEIRTVLGWWAQGRKAAEAAGLPKEAVQ